MALTYSCKFSGMTANCTGLPELPRVSKERANRGENSLEVQEARERKYFEAVVTACEGRWTRIEDDGKPGGHPDYEVTFGADLLSCELKSIGDCEVTLRRNDLRDMIVEELERRNETLWIMTDAPWRNWIESGQITDAPSVARQIVDVAVEVAERPPISNTVESAEKNVGFSFGTAKITVFRAETIAAHVGEFERIDLSARIREVLGSARVQHKTSELSHLPFIVVLFVRDSFDDIKEVATAICGDFEVHLAIPPPQSDVPIKTTLGRTNRFFAPQKNTSISGVLYVPCGPNWSNSPVTLILNPFARHHVCDSWFKHAKIARQDIDLTS